MIAARVPCQDARSVPRASMARAFRTRFVVPRRNLPVAAALLLAFSIATTAAAAAETTRINEFFELEHHSGGWGAWKWRRDDIYALVPGRKRSYLGTTYGTGFTPYGVGSIGGDLPYRAIAISGDGRNIIFSHWPLHAPRKSKLDAGIHRYRHGGTVEATGYSLDSWTRWPKPLPPNLMPFDRLPPHASGDPPARGTPITWAMRADDFAEFPLALLEGQPLHEFAVLGDIAGVSSAVAAGAQLDAETYWGFTALDLTIILGHEAAAIHLLELGADPLTGLTPALFRATMLARMEVIRDLIRRGSDVNMQDPFGNTPLHDAVRAGRMGSIEVSLFFNDIVTPREILEVTTPLVTLLLDSGADPRLRSNDGRKPLDEATDWTPPETIRLLEEWRPPQN